MEIEKKLMSPSKIKLNLGCGTDIREGFVNLDCIALDGVDVVHDLNLHPLPFGDGLFEEILCLDVLEHVDYAPLLKECNRLLRPHGRIVIEVPHFASNNNFVDPTHRNRFSLKTFHFFTDGTFERSVRGYYYDFAFSRVVERKLVFDRSPVFPWNWLAQWLFNLTPRIQQYYEATGLVYLFPAQNLRIILEK